MLEPGTQLGHYEIESMLGRGGMGEVYRGRDSRLRRPVAIKVLAPGLVRDADAIARFRQEAETASALNHPNILTIHDIGEARAAEGPPVHYIAMEWIDGRTLREVMAAGGADAAQLLGFLRQVGAGLAKAHAARIVHRDLKPENVMITADGFAKILDFGLAKLAEDPEAGATMAPAARTKAGVVMGTVGYMSPEQAAGRATDFRSDLFAFGCMLYEALSGTLPFRGDTAIDTLHQVLHADPPPLGDRIPPALAGVIRRCLEKDADRRHASTRDMLDELSAAIAPIAAAPLPPIERPAAAATANVPTAARAERSVAVLPFADLSPGRDHEYIGDGLADEIITALSRVRALRVIARNSAMSYRGTTKPSQEIARELAVEYVLTGSVRVAGERLRISTQLVRADDDRTIWGDRIDGVLDDIFDIQEQVVRTVVAELQVQLSPDEGGALHERPLANVHAYECYLRARRHVWDFTEESLQRALDEIARAEELVGPNTLLIGSKAYVYWQYYNAGIRPDPAYLDRAEALVNEVAGLDPAAPNLELLRGLMFVHRGDVPAAVGHLKRSLVTNPNDVDALTWLVALLAIVGRTDEARPLALRLRDVDPLNWMSRLGPIAVEYYAGAFDRAIEHVARVRESDLQVSLAAFVVVQTYAQAGRIDDAETRAGKMTARDANDPLARLAAAFVHALRGRGAEARAALTPDIEAMCRADLQYSSWIAELLAAAGDRDGALDWLGHAVERGFINHPFVASHDRLLDNLRGDPRFAALVETVKAKWLAFGA